MVDRAARTMEVVWATGVRARNCVPTLGLITEELDIETAAMRMTTLRPGYAPVLNTHSKGSVRDMLGRVVSAPRASILRAPHRGTKQEAALAMLRRSEGATVAPVCEATLWNKETVRGFFAGLKKKGVTVEAAERVRSAGPNQAGSCGSCTTYRVAEEANA